MMKQKKKNSICLVIELYVLCFFQPFLSRLYITISYIGVVVVKRCGWQPWA